MLPGTAANNTSKQLKFLWDCWQSLLSKKQYAINKEYGFTQTAPSELDGAVTVTAH